MAFGFRRGRGKASTPVAPEQAPAPGALAGLISQEISLQPEREAILKKGMDDGLEFYNGYNEARLEFAFDAFDLEMRMALFELIFLLNSNDPSLSEISYAGTYKEVSGGVARQVEAQRSLNLYIEGAPHGVKGIQALSAVFREDLRSFVSNEYRRPMPVIPDSECAIVCLQSIGSIGTISHKSGSSDLDLQVIYDLNPSGKEAAHWSDEEFHEALKHEQAWWTTRLGRREGLSPKQMKDPGATERLIGMAAQQVAKAYPGLQKYLIDGTGNLIDDLNGPKGQEVRLGLINELMQLAQRHCRRTHAAANRKREALLKERIALIQQYINEKYPQAEIYMFACSLDMYRAGRYTSSLDFKESSGSAYELIMNYETLMPGIQFTPAIPSHFVFPPVVNNDAGFYQRLLRYINFNTISIYKALSGKLVDIGHTPQLDMQYVVDHRGAVYWEAFKASSGNLPKALLNLLRYEMLLDSRFLITIMQMIKTPGALNDMVSPMPTDMAETRAALEDSDAGLPNWVLLDMEKQHPALLQDPWWLRFKALKIGFGEPGGIYGLERKERERLSRTIDLAFALHVRVSDIFTKPGDTRQFASLREQVLRKFLESAFPPGTAKREYVEHIFAGEVRAVNQFETELRACFRMSLKRTQLKIAEFDVKKMRRSSDEVKLWHAFYEENFEPKPNAVQRTIMNDLMISRGRLQIGHVIGKGWYFRSLQKESRVGKRFDTFGVLSHLPEEVTLVEDSEFMAGLATCIVNGYYGIFNRGSLKETRTALEFDGKNLDVGDKVDNALAYLRPDQVDRILDHVLEFFPAEYRNHTDYLEVDRCVERVFFFLNVWKFGRLSVLYRDNLGTIYCDEFDNEELKKNANRYHQDHMALLKAPPLHQMVDGFLKHHGLYVNEVELATWVNPNSTETKHLGAKVELKERFLADTLKEIIILTHPSKGA